MLDGQYTYRIYGAMGYTVTPASCTNVDIVFPRLYSVLTKTPDTAFVCLAHFQKDEFVPFRK